MKTQYLSLEHNADDCSDCGECESRCPYKLPIREMLKEAHERFAG